MEVAEHAFPRADGKASDASTSAESVGSRSKRKRALEMYIDEIF